MNDDDTLTSPSPHPWTTICRISLVRNALLTTIVMMSSKTKRSLWEPLLSKAHTHAKQYFRDPCRFQFCGLHHNIFVRR
jgi:hypothetical protein